MIGTLILGWILTLFELDTMLINGINQIFHTNFDKSVYWAIFIIIGLIIHFKN